MKTDDCTHFLNWLLFIVKSWKGTSYFHQSLIENQFCVEALQVCSWLDYPCNKWWPGSHHYCLHYLNQNLFFTKWGHWNLQCSLTHHWALPASCWRPLQHIWLILPSFPSQFSVTHPTFPIPVAVCALYWCLHDMCSIKADLRMNLLCPNMLGWGWNYCLHQAKLGFFNRW